MRSRYTSAAHLSVGAQCVTIGGCRTCISPSRRPLSASASPCRRFGDGSPTASCRAQRSADNGCQDADGCFRPSPLGAGAVAGRTRNGTRTDPRLRGSSGEYPKVRPSRRLTSPWPRGPCIRVRWRHPSMSRNSLPVVARRVHWHLLTHPMTMAHGFGARWWSRMAAGFGARP